MKILSVIGTRPQFVKVAVIVKAFQEYNRTHTEKVEHRLLNTGQHYDPSMSDIFFKELAIPEVETLLGIHPGPPGVQTAAMLASVEASLLRWTPDAVVIYGDTNSTLASALAAVKLHIPLIHLEAGLRSFNRHMQEEINRIVSDHVSDLLLAPTRQAMTQLKSEGLEDRAVYVGDVMLDAVQHFSTSRERSETLEYLGLEPGGYALVTVHRAETTDHLERLTGVICALEQMNYPVIFPVHPRLKKLLGEQWLRMLSSYPHLHLIQPTGYLEMLKLEKNARFILTDSGGVQKEAYFLGVPCLTMRRETEWRETLEGGWNTLVGTDTATILSAIKNLLVRDDFIGDERSLSAFGSGCAGERSVEQIIKAARVA